MFINNFYEFLVPLAEFHFQLHNFLTVLGFDISQGGERGEEGGHIGRSPLTPPSSLCPPLSRQQWSLHLPLVQAGHLLHGLLQAPGWPGQAPRRRGKEAHSGHLLLQLTGGAQSLLQLDISRKTLVAVSPPPGPGLRGAGAPVGVDRERECLPPGQDWAVAQTEQPPAGRGQAGQPQSHCYHYSYY